MSINIDTKLMSIWHIALWSFINSLTCHLWSSDPNNFLKRPKSARLDVWRPGPKSSLASTAAPLESNSSAAATWPLCAARCSGVWPQAVFPQNPSGRCGLPADDGAQRPMRRGGRRKWWECWALLPVQPTKERWMFWTQHLQNCSHSQTHWTSFNTSFLQHYFWWKICNTKSFFNDDEASKDNVIN